MSNPYPARFIDLLYGLRPGELALDCGSGNRVWPSDQCVQLEYADLPCDIRGDGLDLPFRDEAFSLVLSQAVIEHVTDPQRYVDECCRVLEPSGVMYAEVAFIQPIHQAPHHYFNVTPYGLRWLFRDWTIIQTGTIGHFDQTIAKLCRASGVRVPSKISRAVRRPEAAASGVWILASC